MYLMLRVNIIIKVHLKKKSKYFNFYSNKSVNLSPCVYESR